MYDAAQLNPQRRAAIKMLEAIPKRATCVEVGVYRGDFSAFILDIVKPRSLTLVDPWQWREQWHVQHSPEEVALFESGKATSEGELIYRQVMKRYAKDPRVHVERTTSKEGAEHVRDESVDFAFIDADHRYEPALSDLRDWWPKIRPGGYLCGDDYDTQAVGDKFALSNGVRFAVDEFIAEVGAEIEILPWGEGDPRAHFMIQKPGFFKGGWEGAIERMLGVPVKSVPQ